MPGVSPTARRLPALDVVLGHHPDRAAGTAGGRMRRVFLVDDEALALRRLTRMIEATGRVEIFGQCICRPARSTTCSSRSATTSWSARSTSSTGCASCLRPAPRTSSRARWPRSYVVAPSITDLEERYAAAGFFRIHRATLVRLSAIAELVSTADGTRVRLGDGKTELPVARERARALKDKLGL